MANNYFILNDPDTSYTSTFILGTAICSADLEDGNTEARQPAILERCVHDSGEIQDFVWFGWELPTCAEDMADMVADPETAEDVVETFESDVPYKEWDFTGGILAGK